MNQRELPSPEKAVTRAHCNRCGGETNQWVIASERSEYEDGVEEEIVNCFDSYEMLKCCGCERIQMRHTFRHVEDSKPLIIYYPSAMSRREPDWLVDARDLLALPTSLFPLLHEVYAAYQCNLQCLAAMGIRAILENLMRGKVGRQKTFKSLVDEFQKAGYLSTMQALTLESILEAGHAAVHRAWEPSDEDIAALLDITETIIETTYLHERRARGLEKRIPKRPKPS